jgi:hypothetical protein
MAISGRRRRLSPLGRPRYTGIVELKVEIASHAHYLRGAADRHLLQLSRAFDGGCFEMAAPAGSKNAEAGLGVNTGSRRDECTPSSFPKGRDLQGGRLKVAAPGIWRHGVGRFGPHPDSTPPAVDLTYFLPVTKAMATENVKANHFDNGLIIVDILCYSTVEVL